MFKVLNQLISQNKNIDSDSVSTNPTISLIIGGEKDNTNNKTNNSILNDISLNKNTSVNRKANIIIGSPGIIEYIFTKEELTNVEIVIIDEADRILDEHNTKMRYKLTQIFDKLPKLKRVGLFSATLEIIKSDIRFLGMRNPKKVTLSVKKTDTNENIDIIIPEKLRNYI